MPIYDYLCSSCSERTEVIHGIDAPAPRFCPACGAEGTLRKAFVVPAIVFKGSGWAKKDRAGGTGSRTKSATGTTGSADTPASPESTAGGKATEPTGGSASTGSTGSTGSTAGADH